MTDKESNPRQSRKNEEIDLLQLFKSFGDFIVKVFKGLFNSLLMFVIFSIRKWIYLVLAGIFGLGLSYLLSKTLQDLYYSNLVLKSNVVQNQEMISYINRLGSLTSENNYPVLGVALNMPGEKAELIHNLSAFWFIDLNSDGIVDGPDYNSKYMTDTNVTKVVWKFGIRATVTDPSIFSELESGIISYVNSSDYFIRMNEVRLANLEEIIEQTDKEVEKLDSLQKKEYFQLENTTRLKEGQLVFTNDPEITLLHSDLLNLVKDKQRSQTEFEIHSGIISVLEDFIVSQIPENNTSYYARKIVPWFFAITYILLLIIAFRKKIAEAIRK
jgi:hypothetical protein